MNIVQLQDQLKNFSQDQLVREMQMPSGSAPQFLVLGEIMRRQKMQQDFTAQKAKDDQGTVAQEAVAAAGVPQGGIADMARAMAPSTDMTQNTGVQMMYAGGPVKKMQVGGKVKTDPAVIAMANRAGMSVDKYLEALGEEEATRIEAAAEQRAARNRMVGMEPAGDSITMPTQADLDRRFQEQQLAFGASRPLVAPAAETMPSMPPQMGRVIGAPPVGLPSITGAPSIPAMPAADALPRTPAMPSANQLAAMQGAQPSVAPVDAGVLPPPPEQAPTEFVEQFGMESYDPNNVSPGVMERIFGAPALEKIGVETSRTPTPPGQTTGAPLVVPEGGVNDLLPPEAEAQIAAERAAEEAARVAAQGGSGAGGAGGGGATPSGGAGGAGSASSYEQALMDALANREKAAQQDKWLALAQVGLNLMSSTQPTLGGALGEAGLKGVEAARTARDTYDKEKLDLLGALEQSRMARAAASSRAAGGGAGASSGGLSGIKLSQYLPQLRFAADAAVDRVSLLVGGMDPIMAMESAREAGDNAREMQIKGAYDAALQANLDYSNAVRSIGGLEGFSPEDDDTSFSARQ